MEHQTISRPATDFTHDSGQRVSQFSISQFGYKNRQAYVWNCGGRDQINITDMEHQKMCQSINHSSLDGVDKNQ